MKTYVVAVSGGVDSVVLFDMMFRANPGKLVVAHFDHGIRANSADDASFVESLALKNGLIYETVREELGENASEELARDRRYAFLRDVAQKHTATIVTAHHSNDVAETIAINVSRGTGWRGLAAFDSDISRPLLHLTKKQLIDYAHDRDLKWRDDPTNDDDVYLRNRIRRHTLPVAHTQQLLALRHAQVALKKSIDTEVAQLIGEGPQYSRYFLTQIPHDVAVECLRHITSGNLTRPQMERALHAIRTYKAGHAYEAGNGVLLRFTTRNFSCQLLK